MSLASLAKKVWKFLKADTWQSWLASLILMILVIKFLFFPFLSFVTATPLPLVVVESCSMYHNTDFENWWETHAAWYEAHNISRDIFGTDATFTVPFTNGLNKGDIIIVWGRGSIREGDIIIFAAPTRYPIIHRAISTSPLSTKGDNNSDQLSNNVEEDINHEKLMGKAVLRIPLLGWIKLIFFEPLKPKETRGPCQ